MVVEREMLGWKKLDIDRKNLYDIFVTGSLMSVGQKRQ
jgi:hypothetical protein